MADTSGLSDNLGFTVALLASGVAAVPLFRRLGLGSVLGYFAAGLMIGPSVLSIFTDPSAILHVSELGVVMFLFLIGIELRPQKLWAMRSQIFGVGLAQVLLCIALLTGASLAGGVITAEQSAIFSTVIILSMALTPLAMLVADRWLGQGPVSMDGIETAKGLKGQVLLIGFGRFGQIAAQLLLARGAEVSLIDNDPGRIRDATRFGFKVYFGDGARPDILHHSGAAEAEVIMVCVDDRAAALRIATLVREHFPAAVLLVRAYDRRDAIALRKLGVDGEMRETLESAIRFGGMGLAALGVSEREIEELTADIRQRDEERLVLQVHGGMLAGGDRLHRHPVPEPLVGGARKAKPSEASVT